MIFFFLKIKNLFRYSKFHFFILKYKNPSYIDWIHKEIEFHKKFLIRDNLIFDLGANLGDKAHIFTFFTKNIVLYEPEENLANTLRLRFKKYKTIIVNEILVTDQVEVTNFYSITGQEAYSSILLNYQKNFDHLKNNEIVIKKKNSTNLTTEIKKYGLPFYIKVDCEGAEELILKNLDYRIRIISFEANLPKFLGNTLNIMEYFDNKFNSLFNLRRNNQFNFIFKTNTKLDEIKNFLLFEKDTFEVFVFNE
jgi:FkbM family methyltransferase